MEGKEVGDVSVLLGVLVDKNFYIFCMKKPGWNMKLMSTYGNTDTPPNQKTTRCFYKETTGTTI